MLHALLPAVPSIAGARSHSELEDELPYELAHSPHFDEVRPWAALAGSHPWQAGCPGLRPVHVGLCLFAAPAVPPKHLQVVAPALAARCAAPCG